MESSNQKNGADAKFLELPPRRLCEDLDWLREMAARDGSDLSKEARIASATEWSMDQHMAAEMRAQLGLSPTEHSELLERFRERNKQVWGDYSKTDW